MQKKRAQFNENTSKKYYHCVCVPKKMLEIYLLVWQICKSIIWALWCIDTMKALSDLLTKTDAQVFCSVFWLALALFTCWRYFPFGTDVDSDNLISCPKNDWIKPLLKYEIRSNFHVHRLMKIVLTQFWDPKPLYPPKTGRSVKTPFCLLLLRWWPRAGSRIARFATVYI